MDSLLLGMIRLGRDDNGIVVNMLCDGCFERKRLDDFPLCVVCHKVRLDVCTECFLQEFVCDKCVRKQMA